MSVIVYEVAKKLISCAVEDGLVAVEVVFEGTNSQVVLFRGKLVAQFDANSWR